MVCALVGSGKGSVTMKNNRWCVWLLSFALLACKVSYKEEVKAQEITSAHEKNTIVAQSSDIVKLFLDSTTIDYKPGAPVAESNGGITRVDTIVKTRVIDKSRVVVKTDTCFVVIKDTLRSVVAERTTERKAERGLPRSVLVYGVGALVVVAVYLHDRRNRKSL